MKLQSQILAIGARFLLFIASVPCQSLVSSHFIGDQIHGNMSQHSISHNNNNNNTDPMSDNLSYRKENVERDDVRIPIWNIAHMINSIGQISVALSQGANAIETDVSFDKTGRPIEAYHGFPCDCGRHCHFRESFVEFVRHLRQLSAKADTNLQLVVFDLKLKDLSPQSKTNAGIRLAEILHKHLYTDDLKTQSDRSTLQKDLTKRPPIRVLISINHVPDRLLVESFIDYLTKQRLDDVSRLVGFDVGMNDEIVDINRMWDATNGRVTNIWQGDGLTNCANLVRGVDRLKKVIERRNSQGHFKKVYYWTVDVMYHIRSVLRLGIDALMTNQPQRVLQVMAEPEFRHKYRLATPFDDPFMQFIIKPSAWKMSVPSIGEALETVGNIRNTTNNFVRTIPNGLVAALNKVISSVS